MKKTLSVKQRACQKVYNQYPYKEVWNMFSDMHLREMSYWYEGVCTRNCGSYNSWQEWKENASKRVFDRMDMGGVYNEQWTRLVTKKSKKNVENPDYMDANTRAQSHRFCTRAEFKIDIDGNEFTNRPCCGNEAKLCSECWPLFVFSARLIKNLLIQLLDCKKMLFVFSGRRGIHIWVQDDVAMEMTNNQRIAFVDYIQSRLDQCPIVWKEINYIVKMDRNVSVARPHLLKLPFCVHPQTLKICCLFNPDEDPSVSYEKTCTITLFSQIVI